MWWVTLVDLVWDHVGGNFQGRVEHFIFGFDAKYGLKHTTPLQPEEKVHLHYKEILSLFIKCKLALLSKNTHFYIFSLKSP
jgi:hypothetical protein